MNRLDVFRPRDPQSDAMGVLVPALLLTALGLLAVYSFGAPFIGKQALWGIAGVAAWAGDDVAVEEWAAWTAMARVLLNLDETITKE